MKKVMALLAAVIILAGSAGMTASAAVDPGVCRHTCSICHDVRGTHSEKISEQHSMTH